MLVSRQHKSVTN